MRAALGLVVPVFDEARRFDEFGKELVDFVRRLPDGSELVFVDDGSTDGTAELAEAVATGEPFVRVLRRPHEGKGAAVAAGLRSLETPYGAFCDIDLSTPLLELERVIAAAERAPVLAIASRDLATSRLARPEGRVRELLGRTYNRLLQATVTPGIVDTQCGAKAARTDVWRRLLALSSEKRFAWDAEVVALALDIPVIEVPIEWRHDDRSGVKVGRDGVAMAGATAHIWWRARRASKIARDRAPREGEHWWFRSKAALVATAIRRTGGGVGTLVDLGGHDGAVTMRLGWEPGSVVVVDRAIEGPASARARRGLPAVVADAAATPLADGIAAIVTALDVLEHHAHPEQVVAEAVRLLAAGGRLVATVPAHDWLWSTHDVGLGHRRRYAAEDLERLVRDAGLVPVVCTHVFSWLVVPMLVWRRGFGRSGHEARAPGVDRAALALTALERLLIGRVSSPLGTTVLVVARRPS